jgi:purine-binding chemotaxis protein CheW
MQVDEIQRELAVLQEQVRRLQRELGNLRPRDTAGSGPVQLLLCTAGDLEVGFLLEPVKEVLPMAWLSPLPEAPVWVAGVLNLRGRPVVVLDVASRLARAERSASVSDRIVITAVAERYVGLVVQSVTGVVEGELATADHSEPLSAPYLLGTLPRVEGSVAVLSVPMLVAASDLPQVSAAEAEK